MISSPGIGSGLDVNSIITKLMAVESQPLTQLQKTQSNYKSQLSAVSQLKGALSSFQTSMQKLDATSDFKLFSASSSDSTVFTATADSTASLGSHTVQVVRVAEHHQLAASTAYADTTTAIGATGSIQLTVNGSQFSVALDGKNLGQIASDINNASGNTGVSASIITDTAGNHLVLSANDTGSTGYISVGYTGTDPFALQSLNQDRNGSGSFTSADLNAEVVVDSTFTANPTSNQVSTVISGVTLGLVGAGTATLGVQRDTAKVQAQAQGFVDAYNNLHQTLTSLESGTLQGDTTVFSIENRIRDILNTPPSGISSSWSYLAEIGVSLQKDGTMALDATTFQSALTTDFNGVANLFGNNNQGYAYRLQDAANQLVQTGGPLDARTQGLNSRLDTVQSRIDDMTYRLTKIQANYRKQYTALDTLMGTLQTTSTYLTQQLANLKLG